MFPPIRQLGSWSEFCAGRVRFFFGSWLGRPTDRVVPQVSNRQRLSSNLPPFFPLLISQTNMTKLPNEGQDSSFCIVHFPREPKFTTCLFSPTYCFPPRSETLTVSVNRGIPPKDPFVVKCQRDFVMVPGVPLQRCWHWHLRSLLSQSRTSHFKFVCFPTYPSLYSTECQAPPLFPQAPPC